MKSVASEITPFLSAKTIISDVGSSKQSVTDDLTRTLLSVQSYRLIQWQVLSKVVHETGFPTLFENRWCILTPRNRS